jgi:hypothetical protein
MGADRKECRSILGAITPNLNTRRVHANARSPASRSNPTGKLPRNKTSESTVLMNES